MKIAIVTGASSGMGREFVKQLKDFYQNLEEIWVIARRRDRLEELKEHTDTPIRIFEGDLLQENIYEDVKSTLSELNAEIVVLVNAAGFGKLGNVEDIPCQEQLDMIQLNCVSLTHATKICIPHMAKDSRIINLASAAAFCPQSAFSVYAATKSYVLSFSRSLRIELEDKGIWVSAVCPGPVATEFFTIAGQKEKKGVKDAVTVKPENVVRKALVDSKKKRALSVYGFPMKFCRVATKIIPHSIILRVMKGFW